MSPFYVGVCVGGGIGFAVGLVVAGLSLVGPFRSIRRSTNELRDLGRRR